MKASFGIFAYLGCYASLTGRQLPTFLGQRIGPIFKGQAVKLFVDFMTLEGCTETWHRNFGN